MPEGLSPIEAGKQLHEHNQAPPEPARRPVATDTHASSRSARRCCSRWSPSPPPGRAMPRPSGAPSPASSWPAPPRCATWLPGRPGRPVHPQLRLLDLQRLVHRVHRERPPEAGHRPPALPARVPGRLRRLDGHRPAPQPAGPAWTHLPARSTSWPTRPRPTPWTVRPKRRRRPPRRPRRALPHEGTDDPSAPPGRRG